MSADVSTASPSNGSSASPSSSLFFSTPDYVVFCVSLAIPIVIGLFFFFYKRKENTVENFLMGERSINFVAVALSLLASLINGVFVIGTPAEMHYYGMELSLVVLGLFVSIVFVSFVYVPKYHSMTFTSAYEYVEHRFNYPTRVVASAIFCLSVIIFLAVVLYVPALAFAQVTGLSIYITIAVTGIICTVYTTIGGMRAVVWTDAVQMIILLVGLIVIAALGSKQQGGAKEVWDVAVSTGRVNYDSLSADPRSRHTLWTQMFGQGVVYIVLFISNQMMVQRYMAVSTKVQAQATLYIALLMFIPLCMLVVFIGLVLHSKYHACDPLVTKQIETGDQIMPLFIMDVLGKYHGIPGMLMASVFAAALSSVSAVINSLAAVCLSDFIIPAAIHFRGQKPLEKTQQWIAIGLVIFFGLLTIGLSFLASSFTSKLIQATGTIWGVIGGPLGSIFIMGFFMPFCNSAGAITGMLGGLAFTLWVCVGSLVHSPQTPTLPVGLCRANMTHSLPMKPVVVDNPLIDLYNVSYAWYGVIGVGSAMVIGVVVSILTGGCRKSHVRSIDSNLMNLCCCAPSGSEQVSTVYEDVAIVENGPKSNGVHQENEFDNVAFSAEPDVKKRDLSKNDGHSETNTYEN